MEGPILIRRADLPFGLKGFFASTGLRMFCMKWNLRGSVWNRWDPHLHAPGTLLEDQFKGDWEAYLSLIDLPTIKYQSGSIENPQIRESVCKLLEGGRRAFLDRERRYRIDPADAMQVAQDD